MVAYKKPLLEVSNISSGRGDSQFDSFKLFRDENLAAKSGPAKEVRVCITAHACRKEWEKYYYRLWSHTMPQEAKTPILGMIIPHTLVIEATYYAGLP